MMTKIITNTIMIIFIRYFELIFSKNQRLFDFYNFSLSAWFQIENYFPFLRFWRDYD